MLGDRPELVSCVPTVVPTCVVNGPDGDVELNMVYFVAPADAVHFITIELDDFAVAVTPVGTVGGSGNVVAEAGGLDCVDVPPLFDAVTS